MSVKGLTIGEIAVILDALAEYEEEHYMSMDDEEQKIVNDLIEKLQS